MSLAPELWNVGLLAEGFPANICPAEVARTVTSATGAIVDKIAPLADHNSPAGWLLLLRSHDEQKQCLHNHRTLHIPAGNGHLQIKLTIPKLQMNSSPQELNWIRVNEIGFSLQKEERMDSVTTEDMFGGGGEDTDLTDPKHKSAEYRSPRSDGARNIPQPAHPGPPQNIGQGPMLYHQMPPPGQLFYPENVEPGMGYPVQPKAFQGYPMGRGRGMVYPGMQHEGQQFQPPGTYSGVPCFDSNPTYPATRPLGVGGTGSLVQGVGDLNLKQEPFPHQQSYEHQPETFYDADMMGEEQYYQSDFVVLDNSGHDDNPQHHHFYLLVKELPDHITESELRDFFQNRRQSGGGPVAKVDFNPAKRSAAIFFVDSEVITRVVEKSPLLLKDTMIHVETASTEHQEVETEVKTVEIRGLQTEDETEMCTYYFENPMKGGGDIESSVWNEEEKIFYITFTDPKVAEAICSKGHKLGDKVLEVTLYTPADEPEDGQPQCTVEVRGFDPAKIDLYEMYFSNPRRGGDNIIDLCVNEDQTVMYITFETPEVAEHVAAGSHKVGKRQLEVKVAPVEVPTPPSTVVIRGGDLSKAEMYRFYFENPRKGGGDITDFTVDEEQQSILITFDDPEVAQTVITMKHKIGGRNLELSMYTPKKETPKRHRSHEPTEEEEEAPSGTVVVMVGQQPLESEDTYTLYFESPRHGGGEVEDVSIDEEKKLIYVTFVDPAVAARVAEAQHKIAGRKVEVKLPKPRPTYPEKLLFKYVADSTTRDCLCMYLERVTGLEPQEVLYSDENGTVLVTFEQEPDLGKTCEMLRKRKLEGRLLIASKVPISNCLLVENLSSVTTEDTVALYFENKRSSGGPVEKVEMAADGNKCLVYFESHEVLDGVLSKQHKIDGSKLVVKRYMECLGPSGGSEDPTAFTMPKPLVLESIDPYKVAFLHHSQAAKAGFLQELSSNHAQAKFERDSLSIVCTLTPAVPKARIIARTWAVDVKDTVESYLKMIEVLKRDVMQQLWQEVEQAVSAAGISSPEGAVLFPLSAETAFVVVGMKSMAQELFDKICAAAKAKEDEIERKNQEVTETNSKLPLHQLRLLLAMSFQVEAGKRYDGLRIDINIKKNCIVFHGLFKDVKQAQLDMYEVLQTVKGDKVSKMTDMQKKVLENKETKPYIVQKFKSEKISAVWELDKKNELHVFAFSDPSLVKAVHIIKKSLPEHVCQLSPESSELLPFQGWRDLVSRLTSANPGVLHIAPSHDNQQVFITCIDSIMHGVVEDVEMFLQENTIYSQVVRFSPSRQQFLHENWQQKLVAVQGILRAYKVQINLRESGTEIYVKGTNDGLREVRKKLEEMNAQIVCHAETFTDQAKVKFLTSPQISKDLKMLGQTHHCVVTLKPEAADLEVVQSGSQGSAKEVQISAGTLASVQLKKGESVLAIQGDITQLHVDVIVNAANNRMDHIGGLARDIVVKGGQTIQDECFQTLKSRGNQLSEGDILVSGAGQLPCKAVIHAIGPMFRGGHSGEEDCLHETIMKCMVAATEAGYTSIAFPAISTGIFQYPPKKATLVITEAIKTYFDSHRKSTIKSVYLCHLKADIVQMFSEAIGRVFPSARSSSTVARKPVSSARNGNLPAAVASGGAKSRRHVINVSIVAGEIAKQTADVLINSTSSGLDLQNGAVSSSILRVAGAGLQDECWAKYPNGIQAGEIACTSGYGLGCREVYHLALCNWSNPNAQQILGSSVARCLAEASKQHYTSIAFPVLGTGNLGYPPATVAETMLGAIDQFQQKTPSTSLRNARIVIYHADKGNLQVFQAAQKKVGLKGGVFSAPQASSSGIRQARKFSSTGESQPQPSPQAASKSGASAVFEIGDLRLVIKQGDITEEAVDAIVNSSNAQLDLSRGNVAGALKRKCGPELVRECDKKAPDMHDRNITHTKAYQLKSKMILHINAEEFSADWKAGIKLCLQEAEDLGIQSLAMPALGTGAYGQTPAQAAGALFTTLTKFFSGKTHTLQEVRVVLYDIKMIPPFVSAVESLGNKYNETYTGGIVNWFKSVFTGSSTPSVRQTYIAPKVEEATLYIYAGQPSDVAKVLESFDDLVKDRFVRRVITDEILLDLDPAEIRQIHEVGHQFNVEINIRKAAGQVRVDGLQNEVFDAIQMISSILRKAEHKRQEAQTAAMLANMVQWSYLEVTSTGTEKIDYAEHENQIIEVAYKSKKKTAEITDTVGNVYVIDFASMTEYPKDNRGDTVGVLRRDKIQEMGSGSIPENWDTHTDNEHVKVVSLAQTDSEYQKVEANFRATLGNNRGTLTITAIDRIQNRTLYLQYAAKKAHLEKQNAGIENEKTLWHGTASDAVDNINNYGFNRSYCGKNATVHGEGVYFAINSNYSTHPTYSPPDPSGNRRIYQCKVLVGHATVSGQNLRVLPARQGPILFDSATDNPSNPSMYVIFNDTQAYPEYMITFK